jgi:hypothetical protein
MAELTVSADDVERLEQLVKRHFGPDFTAKLAWNILRNRYQPSDQPRRLACPQRLFGVPVWWRNVAEFRSNLGFRLELWDPAYLSAAQALVRDYNATAPGARLELEVPSMYFPASTPPVPAAPRG